MLFGQSICLPNLPEMYTFPPRFVPHHHMKPCTILKDCAAARVFEFHAVLQLRVRGQEPSMLPLPSLPAGSQPVV